MNQEEPQTLGTLFSQMHAQVENGRFDDGLNDDRFGKNPTELTDNEIDALLEKGKRLAAFSLADSVTDRHDGALHSEIAETAMERAFMLWEIEARGSFVEVFRGELERLARKRKKKRGSDEMFYALGSRILKESIEEFSRFHGWDFSLGETASKSLVDEAIETAVFELKSEGHSPSQNLVRDKLEISLSQRAEKLVLDAKAMNEKIADAPDAEKNKISYTTEEQKAIRERALSITDPAELDEAMYEQLVEYGVSVASKRNSWLDRSTRYEVARMALSRAVVTFDVEIAAERNARFGTHLTWQIMREVKTIVRKMKREVSTEDVLPKTEDGPSMELVGMDVELLTSQAGVEIHNAEYTISEEYIDKIYIGIRQVRHEMPRIINTMLDLRFGEILKEDGTPYKNREYAELIGVNVKRIGELQAKGLKLMRAKLKRRGFIESITDESVTAEEMTEEEQFLQAVRERREAEELAATLPPEGSE